MRRRDATLINLEHMSPSARIRLLVSCTALPYWALMMLLIWTRRDLGMPEQWAYSAAPTLVIDPPVKLSPMGSNLPGGNCADA